MKIDFDGNIIEDKFIFGMISNANSVGGFKSITGKDVALNDGLFEVLLVKMPENIIELQKIINALLLSDPKNNSIYKFKASNIKIECDRAIYQRGEYHKGVYGTVSLESRSLSVLRSL